MRARPALTIMFLLGLLVGLLAVAPGATAATCAPFPASAHCYGAVGWGVTSPSGFLGIDTKVRTNCQTISNYSVDVATNEEWYDTTGSGSQWVEAGVLVGDTQAGVFTTPRLFWADQVGSTFTDHIGGAYTLNTYQDFRIYKTAGSTTISITRNGVASGQSFGQPTGPSTAIVAGTETTTNSVHSYGSISDMTYENLTGGWVSGWTGAGFVTDTPPWTTAWANPQIWMTSLAGATC